MSESHSDEMFVPEIVPDPDVRYLENQSRYGNSIGWGDEPALLLVDVTEAFVDTCRTCEDLVPSLQRLLEGARDAGIPVFYSIPDDKSFPREYPVTIKAARKGAGSGHPEDMSDEKQEWLEQLDTIPPALEPTDDEVVIEKPRASAFFDTHLSNLLHHYDIDTLVVAGLTTSGCVRATVTDSHSSNFRTIVPQDCVGDAVEISHQISLFDIGLRYGDVTTLQRTLEKFEAAD